MRGVQLLQRRNFLKLAGLAAGAVAASADAFPWSLNSELAKSITVKQYGLLECADPKITQALARSTACILTCTLNDQTHCGDAGRTWGTDTWLNDLYFGMHGGLFIGGEDQHAVFCKEMRKIARHVSVAPGRPPVPYAISADGRTPSFNPDPGIDLDRCAQFILEVARAYEVTGDRELVVELYPKCLQVMNYLTARDLDGDLLPEGRTEAFTDPPGKGVGACTSLTYIGDTAANTWKDFGLSLFYYEALRRIAFLEQVIGKKAETAHHLQHAARVQQAVRKILWNEKSDGFLAWVEKNGTPHDDWITGNNLHAVACGLASPEQCVRILKRMDDNRSELENIVPCRVRIGLFADGLCSNRPNYYWNGGIWTLVSAPDMIARARMNDLSRALRVAELLSTRPKVTEVGFFEAYDGKTGEPNDCRGLLMNNGGFLWGFFEGVLGIKIDGDELRFRSSVPERLFPARARIHYRGADFDIHWNQGKYSSASLDGKRIPLSPDGYYRARLVPELKRAYKLEILQGASAT